MATNLTTSITSLDIFFILAAGILPALLWLWFWLKEDQKRPEPRGLIVLSFFVGSLGVLITLPFQEIAAGLIPSGVWLLFVWAGIEELIKLVGAYVTDFRRRTYDEPIDAMIYLITVSLGFAAYENVLFVLKSIRESGIDIAIMTAIMRFLGSSLLHVLSSAVLGGIIAIAYCKPKPLKKWYALFGLFAATFLHTLFNFFIINGVGSGASGQESILLVFTFLWIGIIALILFFERVKRIICTPVNPHL